MEWAAEIIFQSFRVRGECHEWMMSARNGKNEVTRLRWLCLIVECGKNILTFTFFFAIKFQFSPLPIRRTQKKQPAQLWFIDLKMDFAKYYSSSSSSREIEFSIISLLFFALPLFSNQCECCSRLIITSILMHEMSVVMLFFTNIRNNKFSKPRRSNQIWISSPHPGTMRWAEDLSDLH